MPMNRRNTRSFHRRLYATQLEKIRVLKRGDDQDQGTVVSITLYECRRSKIEKSGETLDGDMNVNHTCTWHIPKSEMIRTGINYFNPADRIEQLDSPENGYIWQPEATTSIETKLFGNHICIHCLLVNPAVSRIT